MGQKSRNNVGVLGKAVARLLQDAQQGRGVSQVQLCAMTGISQSQLSKMLGGKRAITIDELGAICLALNVSGNTVLTEAAMMAALGVLE